MGIENVCGRIGRKGKFVTALYGALGEMKNVNILAKNRRAFTGGCSA